MPLTDKALEAVLAADDGLFLRPVPSPPAGGPRKMGRAPHARAGGRT
jgi:hypothetical protein